MGKVEKIKKSEQSDSKGEGSLKKQIREKWDVTTKFFFKKSVANRVGGGSLK